MVFGAFFNVESQWQYVKWISANRSVIPLHIVEEGILVAQVVVGFHLGVDSPLVGNVGLLF